MARRIHDVNGPYQVTSFDGKSVWYKYAEGKYADGTERKGDAETKWTIDRNIRRGPTPAHSSSRGASSYMGDGGFFTHPEAFPIVANAIETYSQRHSEFMLHEKIIAALLRDPQAQVIAARRPDKTPKWCLGQMVAWFSKVFTVRFAVTKMAV